MIYHFCQDLEEEPRLPNGMKDTSPPLPDA